MIQSQSSSGASVTRARRLTPAASDEHVKASESGLCLGHQMLGLAFISDVDRQSERRAHLRGRLPGVGGIGEHHRCPFPAKTLGRRLADARTCPSYDDDLSFHWDSISHERRRREARETREMTW